jgi:hypothetical protein
MIAYFQLQTQTEHFKPLIKTNCSPHIKFFVCSVFAPMCPEAIPQAVTSCRAVCEEVRKSSLPLLILRPALPSNHLSQLFITLN